MSTTSGDQVMHISDAIATAAKDSDVVLKDKQKEAVAQHTCETAWWLHLHYTCMHCGHASSSHPLKAARLVATAADISKTEFVSYSAPDPFL